MPQSEKIMSIEITSALASASTSASHVDYVTTEREGSKEYIQNNNAYKSFVKWLVCMKNDVCAMKYIYRWVIAICRYASC